MISDLHPRRSAASAGAIDAPDTEPLGVDLERMALDSEDDSFMDDEKSYVSSRKSATSSILKYREFHGRTYHNFEGAEYWGPNDEKQNEGLDMAHRMMDIALGNKLFLAPLKNPQSVLDIGTGTGIWAIDFADEHPSASVTGTDISPIQPDWIPPNCRFELDNCELDWTFTDDAFDYIHIRCMAGCVKDWPKLYRECLRCLKPGGWLEHHEFAPPIVANEGSLPDDCVWRELDTIFADFLKKTGRSFAIPESWVEWLREAGFSDVLHTNSVRLPIGGWALDENLKEVGILNKMFMENSFEGFASYIGTQVLDWTKEDVSLLLERVSQAVRDRSLHAYYHLNSIYTRKPP